MTEPATDYRYPGGKAVAGLTEWILDQFPAHVFYAEPFAGHAATFRHKTPALRSWLIDQDSDVVDWWHTIFRGRHRHQRRGTTIIQADGIRFVELAGEWNNPDLFIYCDPPYLPSTRVKKRLYRHEMTEHDHNRLLDSLVKLRSPAAVSGYRSPLYLDRLKDWTLTTRDVITRGGTMREECLWRNKHALTPSPFFQVTYSELGSNFRDRQRVARKQTRWVHNFAKLPTRERRAILLALLEAEKSSTHRHEFPR